MRTSFLRRALVIAFAAVAATAAGCERKSEGVVQVLVIGGEPKLVDPYRGPLGASEAVLMDNVAQGLVRFDARGQIEPGLAETWNVSDDGLSYIFRLANGKWPDGRKITAQQVAKTLRRLIADGSRNPLKDAFGAVEDVVAMTDRVIEIRLRQPRPHLLQLLAQPEMGLVYERQGTGPFSVEPAKEKGSIRLVREIATIDEEQAEQERLDLAGSSAEKAVAAFVEGKADLVLGGTFADLPIAHAADIARGALHFDPASGLFGLMPARATGPASNPEIRQMLSAAIDRDALISSLAVPALVPRATVLEPGLDNIPDPVAPTWTATPLADRRPALVTAANHLLAEQTQPKIAIALPEGPGADILFARLSQDWGALGIAVERVAMGKAADFTLVDEVAPSSSAAWFLRRFHCGQAPVCDEGIDELLDAARQTPILAQRSALLDEASRQIDDAQLFVPLTAPIRWSLVSPRITGFAGNRFAIHTLTGLEQRLDRAGE